VEHAGHDHDRGEQNVLALLSLLADDDSDEVTAAALAQQAMSAAEAAGISFDPLNEIAYIALGRAAARRGDLAEAEQLLERALQTLGGMGSFVVQYAQALLEIASIRRARGETARAHATVHQVRELISQFTDPGMLPSLLDSTERGMPRTARRRPQPTTAPTARELVVLRLLATQLWSREIARELSVSVNTVRTQIRAIHRKLQVTPARRASSAPESWASFPARPRIPTRTPLGATLAPLTAER
jgi:LuxR family maltose regulon positive regulatory protein